MQCCCSRAARRRVSNPGRSWFSSTSIQASQATTTSLGDRPFRVGIVGGGPAGFYTAARLLALPGSDKLNVDLFELLPTPFGLARFGVAPDHPEVKNCEHKFEETARDPRFRFFGNVQIGGRVESSSTTDEHASTATIVPNLSPSPYAIQVPLSALRPHYDAMILTYGASLDRPLGIPGEDTLSNVLSARSFVNWYNGHPYHSALLAPLIDLSKLDHVTVIGQGNVALDVARILLKNPDDLAEFDVPESVLEALRASRVKHVDVVGRRGPLQLAATTKELREMMNLPGVGFETDRDLLRDAMDVAERYPGMDMARMRKRALGLLDKGSKTSMTSADKSWKVEFLRSPTELAPGKSGNEEQEPSPSTLEQLVRTPEKVGSVRYAINELIQEDSSVAHTDPSKLNARSTGRHEVRHTDMVLKSVGYRSIGLPGLPFDSRRGIVRNDSGRVTDEQGNLTRGLYVSGWLARGPTGVIATTMFDAFATADLVAADLVADPPTAEAGPLSVSDLERYDSSTTTTATGTGQSEKEKNRARRIVNWQDWERLDQEERSRGKARGKLREKMTDVGEMLNWLG